MPIKRETLYKLRTALKAPEYQPTVDTIHMLLDACLEQADVIDGGNTQIQLTMEVRNGLADLTKALSCADQEAHGIGDPVFREMVQQQIHLANYTARQLDFMVRATPGRRKPWSVYREMIREEFGE
jgi:hypothetical protein